MFSTEIGVVHLNTSSQTLLLVAFVHGLHQLLLHRPGRLVVDTQLTRQVQGRYALFVLSESVDSQKPNAQRQFGVGENRPSGYGRLMMAAMTLIAVTVVQLTVCGIATHRAGKAIGPAQFEQRLVTLRFGAIAREKIGQTQAFLKLNGILRHG